MMVCMQHILIESGHENRRSWVYAYKGVDKPANSRSLICAFVVRCHYENTPIQIY